MELIPYSRLNFQVLPFEACLFLISGFTFEVSISIFDFTNFNFRLERSYFGWRIFQFSISNWVFLFKFNCGLISDERGTITNFNYIFHLFFFVFFLFNYD